MPGFVVGVTLIGAVLCLYAGNVVSQQRGPTAAGTWEKLDASGRPVARFVIYECDGRFFGRIDDIESSRPGHDPGNWRCTQCKGEQKNAPVIGLMFIRNMKRNGLYYEDGTILDPRDGSNYSARMELSPDGSRLMVRGYLGIPLLGRTETWHRASHEAGSVPEDCGRSSLDL
jgi:hypothetical protein